MAGRDHAADPAFDLEAENEGEQQRLAADFAQLGQCERGRCDRRGGMDHRREMRIAEVEDIGAGGIQERRAERIDAVVAPDDGRLRAARKFRERGQGHLDRVGTATRERDREKVEQGTLGFAANRVGNVAPARVDDKTGEVWRDAGSVQHGIGLGCFLTATLLWIATVRNAASP